MLETLEDRLRKSRHLLKRLICAAKREHWKSLCRRIDEDVLFSLRRFLAEWKTARVVLIPKPGKEDMSQPSSFRSICLISRAGKLFEYLVKERLMKSIGDRGGLSPTQFGFVEGKSTVHAILYLLNKVWECRQEYVAVIAFDVLNAFNTAPWDIIVQRVEEKIGRGLS